MPSSDKKKTPKGKDVGIKLSPEPTMVRAGWAANKSDIERQYAVAKMLQWYGYRSAFHMLNSIYVLNKNRNKPLAEKLKKDIAILRCFDGRIRSLKKVNGHYVYKKVL